MGIPEVDIYVRYCETDASGHVNNISFLIYLEEARTKFLQGIGFSKDKRGNLDFIVASVKCDYISQAYVHQILTVTTKVERVGGKSFTLKHAIKLADTGVLVAAGSAVIVCFNYQQQQSVAIPSKLRAALERYLVPV